MKTATVAGITAEARTVAAARELAELDAAAIIEGAGYPPRLIRNCRGHILLVFCLKAQWSYCIIPPDAEPMSGLGCQHCMGAGRSFGEDGLGATIRQGLSHMAQNTWTHTDGLNIVSPLFDPADRADLTRWIRWQLHYRALVAAGASDVEAHAQAQSSYVTPEEREAAAEESRLAELAKLRADSEANRVCCEHEA